MSYNTIKVDLSRRIIVNTNPQKFVIGFNSTKTNDVAFGYDVFDGDGSTKDFELASACKENGLVVFFNGVVAKQGISGVGLYTLNSSRTILTFHAAPAGGDYKDEILAFYAKD